MRGLFGGWTGGEGEEGPGLEPLKTLRWDEAPQRRGIDWKHFGMEDQGRGKEVEPVEGVLSREVRV